MTMAVIFPDPECALFLSLGKLETKSTQIIWICWRFYTPKSRTLLQKSQKVNFSVCHIIYYVSMKRA